MLRFTMVLSSLAIIVSTAQAAECRSPHSAEVVEVTGWNAAPPDNYGLSILNMRLTNRAAAAIRMIDGYVVFTDALGGEVDDFTIDRDLHLAIGAEGEAKALLRYSRLTELDPADVSAVACLRAVLFEDGTRQDF